MPEGFRDPWGWLQVGPDFESDVERRLKMAAERTGFRACHTASSWLSSGKCPGLSEFRFTHKTINVDQNNMYETLHTPVHSRRPINMADVGAVGAVGAVVDGLFQGGAVVPVSGAHALLGSLPPSVDGNRGLLLTITMWPR